MSAVDQIVLGSRGSAICALVRTKIGYTISCCAIVISADGDHIPAIRIQTQLEAESKRHPKVDFPPIGLGAKASQTKIDLSAQGVSAFFDH